MGVRECKCMSTRIIFYFIFVVRLACSFVRWFVRFAWSPAYSTAFGLQRTQKCYLNLSTESNHFIESRLLRVFRA